MVAGVEEQFYLLSPLLVSYLSRRRLTQTLIACIIAAPVLRAIVWFQLPGGSSLAYVLMPCRADGLAMGMLAAVLWRSNSKIWVDRHPRQLKFALGLLVMGALVMLKWSPGPYAKSAFQAVGQYSWFAALYTCLLLVVLQGGILARAARWSFLRECGRLSYCIYLIHLAGC